MTEAIPAPDPMIAERDAATDAVVNSAHRRRVIVAGPGTGKSTTFKKALVQRGDRGLALTFLRLLAADLKASLASEADAYTFHGFAKNRMKIHTPAGLTASYEIYPPLMTLETWDLGILGVHTVRNNIGPRAFNNLKSAVENRLQTLDFASGIPDRVLGLGTYYDAAAFPDLVLRMYIDQADRADHIPAYPLVVVDEYQDFSPLETAIIDQLGSKSDLLIAGDDDQALYAFREASPAAIRGLAADPSAELFPLPFCSRCTSVIVDAVLATVERATAIGRLPGRLEKPFRCFLPSKGPDSEAHPKIFDVRCTWAPYMKRYVAARIAEIPQEDIAASVADGYPTVLVIGPAPFMPEVAAHLATIYPEAKHKPSDKLPVLRYHGYKYIARNPASNLGWRILLHLMRPAGWDVAVRSAVTTGDPLAGLLEAGFRDEHLAVAELLKQGWAGALDETGRKNLAAFLDVDIDHLDTVLNLAKEPEPPEEEGEDEQPVVLGEDPEADTAASPVATPLVPTIMFTSLLGAKGLSAAHVFVVGCSNGHFPRSPTPTDVEICEFIVALSRTRKACHLLSSRWLGQVRLNPSVFLEWVSDQTAPVVINKDTVDALTGPKA